jgi:hypothetical protein
VYSRYLLNPSSVELAAATKKHCMAHNPEVLDSKVEESFHKSAGNHLNPPQASKFQPIELVCGVAKQRAGTLYFKGRKLIETREHWHRGFYNGIQCVKGEALGLCTLRGCWKTAEQEIDKWIAVDEKSIPGRGLTSEHLGDARKH